MWAKLKRVTRLESFWPALILGALAALMYAFGSMWVSGWMAGITMFFVMDCFAETWPKYLRRIQNQRRTH